VSGSLGSKLTTLLSGGVVSKLLGVAREIALAYAFGTSYVADAFRVAMTALLLPTHFFTGEALAGAFIPAYRREAGEGRERLVRSVFTLLLAAMLLVAVALLVAAPIFVSILAPGFEAPARDLSARLIRVGSVGVLLYSISALLVNVQVAHGDYLPYAARPSVQNVAVFAAIVAAAAWEAPVLLALGFVAAYAVMAAWTMWRMGRSDLAVRQALRPTRSPGGPHLNVFKRSVGHLALFVLLTQGSIVVDRLVATLTGVGGVASLDYAHFVTDSVRMLLAVPIATLALGQLGGLKWSAARASVERALTVLLFGSLLVSIFVWGLSEDVVTVLYRRGEFQETATGLTSAALRGFAIGTWAATTGYVFLRVFNATLRNREVAIAGAVSLAVNVALDLALYGPLGVYGVALATSVSAIVFLALLAVWSGTARTLFVHAGLPALLLVPLAIVLPRLPAHGLLRLLLGAGLTGAAGVLVLLVWPPLRRDLSWALARLGRRRGSESHTDAGSEN
jgi:putative peptidoglycan lipid II flippase